MENSKNCVTKAQTRTVKSSETIKETLSERNITMKTPVFVKLTTLQAKLQREDKESYCARMLLRKFKL